MNRNIFRRLTISIVFSAAALLLWVNPIGHVSTKALADGGGPFPTMCAPNCPFGPNWFQSPGSAPGACFTDGATTCCSTDGWATWGCSTNGGGITRGRHAPIQN